MEEQSRGGAGLGVASMVLGIIALVLSCCVPYVPFLCAVVSIVLAAVAIKGNREGKGMAIAGLVCSIISLIPSVIVLVSGAAILSAIGASL
ncbi:MAG: hypothetical protein K2N90_05210 [Lachnospiraceae bacterium]|nr:hypothetical protein [Lachnospiraceae bacterium]